MTIYYHELQHVKESKVAYSDTNRSYAQCLDHNQVRLITREFADKVDALIVAGELPEYEFDELPSHHAYNDFGNRIEECKQS